MDKMITFYMNEEMKKRLEKKLDGLPLAVFFRKQVEKFLKDAKK